jgi:hypothetical protein
MPDYVQSSLQQAPPASLRTRVEAAMGCAWLSHATPETGLSAAHRFVVELAGGEQVFVKAATSPQTAQWLRNEHRALQAAPADLTPRILAWLEDDPARPILIVEALAGRWPAGHGGVAWRPGDLDAVLSAIHRLGGVAADGLPQEPATRSDGWRRILRAPEPFLRLGLGSAAWLAAHGEALAEAEEGLVRDGEAFVHGDMRSDNICFGSEGVKFVDWSDARRGAAETDPAALLPTAHLEGGPEPDGELPNGDGWGAAQGADLALRAIGDDAAPAWLRRIFVRLAAINIDWALRCLGRPPRDGPRWESL